MSGYELLPDLIRQVAWNRETETTVQSVDQGIHPDHLSIDVTERTAAVAWINRGVGLQVIRDGVTTCRNQFIPSFAANYAVGEGVIEFERSSDSKGELSNPHGV